MQDAADGRGRNACLAGDLATRAAQSAQTDHVLLNNLGCRLMKAMRPRRAVSERLQPADAEPAYPLGNRLETGTEGGGNNARRLALDDHPARDLGSTMQRGVGILVDVHSAYLRRN